MKLRHRLAAPILGDGGSHQQRPGTNGMNLLQGQQGMAQVVENAKEHHQIEGAKGFWLRS